MYYGHKFVDEVSAHVIFIFQRYKTYIILGHRPQLVMPGDIFFGLLEGLREGLEEFGLVSRLHVHRDAADQTLDDRQD